MKEKYIKLLQSKIDKLDHPDFDLDAWKTGVMATLINMPGKADERIKLIEELKVDYGSWALRDATSTYNPRETCKKQGREIINTIIEEIELFGVPNKENPIDKIFAGDKLEESLQSGNWQAVEDLLKKMKKESLIELTVKLLKSMK